MTMIKSHFPEFKARIARDAMRKDLTLAELSKKSGVPSGQINTRKRAVPDNMTSGFRHRDLGVGAVILSLRRARLRLKRCIPRLGSLLWRGIFWLNGSIPRSARQKMVRKDHKLSVRRQYALKAVARSKPYYQHKGESAEKGGLV